jgi:hypothetical protein
MYECIFIFAVDSDISARNMLSILIIRGMNDCVRYMDEQKHFMAKTYSFVIYLLMFREITQG